MPAGELTTRFTAARDSGRPYRGLTGPDRYHLSMLAATTGFRAAALTPVDFDRDAGTVTLPARFNKSRETKGQPILSGVVELLRVYFAGKAPRRGSGSASGRASGSRHDLTGAVGKLSSLIPPAAATQATPQKTAIDPRF